MIGSPPELITVGEIRTHLWGDLRCVLDICFSDKANLLSVPRCITCTISHRGWRYGDGASARKKEKSKIHSVDRSHSEQSLQFNKTGAPGPMMSEEEDTGWVEPLLLFLPPPRSRGSIGVMPRL